MTTLIRGARALSGDQLDIEISDGRIGRVGQALQSTADSVYDASGLLVFPGLVNAHTHSPDNLVRGVAPDLPLELWSLTTSAGRENRTPREVYLSAMLGCIELLKTGTTTVLDHIRFNPQLDPDGIEAVTRAYEDAGIRAVIAPIVADKPVVETMPLSAQDWQGEAPTAYGRSKMMPAREQASIVESYIKSRKARTSGASGASQACPASGGLVTAAVGPSAPQRCTDELLCLCGSLSQDYGVPLHTHVLETRVQQEMARLLYKHGMVRHLSRLGLLSERTNLVHLLWASDEDLDIIAESGASVVHNPVSNTRLNSGFADVPGMLSRGIGVALGTDSSCCNDSNNTLETMKWASILHNLSSSDPSRWVTPARGFAMGTAGGAGALGLGAVTGKIETGMAADLVLVPLYQSALVPLCDPTRQIVLGGASLEISAVFVNGRLTVEHGKCLTIDEREIFGEAIELGARRMRDEQGAFRSAGGLYAPVERMYRRIHNI